MGELVEAAKRLLLTHGCPLPPEECADCRDLRAAIAKIEGNVDATEAAAILVVSRTTIQDLIARGHLRPLAATPDGKHSFRRLDVEALHIERALHPARRGGKRRRAS